MKLSNGKKIVSVERVLGWTMIATGKWHVARKKDMKRSKRRRK